jgi:hypothetical protein
MRHIGREKVTRESNATEKAIEKIMRARFSSSGRYARSVIAASPHNPPLTPQRIAS